MRVCWNKREDIINFIREKWYNKNVVYIFRPVIKESAYMFCSNCGKQLEDGDKVCGFCGKQVVHTVGNENAIKNVTVKNTSNANEFDEPSTGINVLCFFIPVIGLTLYFAWKSMYPKKAKAALKVALIGFLTWTVLSVVLRLSIDFIVYWMISNM